MTCRVDLPSFGINYDSISLANFPATLYFVFYLKGGLRPPQSYGAKYNVARKLVKRNGAMIYAKAGRIYPTYHFPLTFVNPLMYPQRWELTISL